VSENLRFISFLFLFLFGSLDDEVAEQITGPTADCHWVLPGRLLIGDYPGSRTNKAIDSECVTKLVQAGTVWVATVS
jgi:hypothetical protein